MSNKDQPAWLAVGAAGLGLVAIAAVVASGMFSESTPEAARDVRGGASTSTRGSTSGPSRSGGAEPVEGTEGAEVRHHPDGGLETAAVDEEELPVLEALGVGRVHEAPPPPTPEEAERARVEAERVADSLTIEQRYRAQSFFLDMLIQRADQLRTQLSAARAAGDARAVRRMESMLGAIEGEIERSRVRTRELEAELEAAGGTADGAEEATDGEDGASGETSEGGTSAAGEPAGE